MLTESAIGGRPKSKEVGYLLPRGFSLPGAHNALLVIFQG